MSEKQAVRHTNEGVVTATRHDFGFIDRLRRKVGCRIQTWEVDLVALSDEDKNKLSYWGTGTPGHWFCSQVMNTRDGIGYGAHQSAMYHKTDAARASYIAKYIDGSKKRMWKKFAEYNR
jgi:hypothetical protein